jgi:hypothetical protein
MVGGNRYRFTDKAPEAIPGLNMVDWKDLLWLMAPTKPQERLEVPLVRLVRRAMPPRADWLLRVLQAATRGKKISRYPSRSEAEAAVIAMLILAGWTREEIRSVFAEREPGHYKRRAKPEAYVDRTYTNVLNALAASPVRAETSDMYRLAKNAPWSGRGGGLDQKVYLALLSEAWHSDSWEPFASERELAEHTSASRSGVRNALRRLVDAGLIAKLSRSCRTRSRR